MNAPRPDGYRHERLDCAVHALAAVAAIDYATAHSLLAHAGRRARCRTGGAVILKALQAAGLMVRPVQVPRGARRAQLLDHLRPKGIYWVRTTGHSLAVIDHLLVCSWPEQSPRALIRQILELRRPSLPDRCMRSVIGE